MSKREIARITKSTYECAKVWKTMHRSRREVHARERRDTQREGKPMRAGGKGCERKGTNKKRRACI